MDASCSPPLDSKRVDRAFALAGALHCRQTRKGSAVPYVSHLWLVAGLVADMGGTEDEIVAAVLHDAVEDQGGLPTLAEIKRHFGPVVADLVHACSDSLDPPKRPWRERKEGHLAKLAGAELPVLRITLADKIQNAWSIVVDRRRHGDGAFEKFSGQKAGTLWYYAEILALLRQRLPSPWTEELAHLVDRMKESADPPQGSA